MGLPFLERYPVVARYAECCAAGIAVVSGCLCAELSGWLGAVSQWPGNLYVPFGDSARFCFPSQQSMQNIYDLFTDLAAFVQ